VFEAIRAARPPRLYIAADGPRASRAGEAERCAEVRRIATAVDWPCELHTLFRGENRGCKLGVSEGIDWFFEHEAEGIVLEDDILPLPSFFPYCEALLERHRDDPRVALVCGTNLIADRYQAQSSYLFTHHSSIWGWAAWRRSWQGYDAAMRDWPAWDAAGGLERLFKGDRCAQHYWRALLNRIHRGEVDTWDYQWLWQGWRNEALAILPAAPLATNLGFGPDATHTVKGAPEHVRRAVPREMAFPLVAPPQVQTDARADRLIQRHVIGLGHWRCLRRAVRRMFGRWFGRP